MAWRVAKSLLKLRDQINNAYPNRNKASDGTIGDPNHQAEGTGSDHNPNKAGVVCALDITHDPANGVDIDKLSDQLLESRDSRIKYVIANGLILVPADYGWKWIEYNGSNPHTSHMHVSVYGDYDNEAEWKLTSKGDTMTEEDAKWLYVISLHRQPESDSAWKHWVGRSFSEWAKAMVKDKSEWHTQNGILISEFQAVKAERNSLLQKLEKMKPTDAEDKLNKIKEILK